MALDGADIGSFAQNWPSNYVNLRPEAIGDVQIKTGGVDASAPTAMGMVINVATRSGTDQLRGSAAIAVAPLSWNDNNMPNGTSPASELVQPDFASRRPGAPRPRLVLRALSAISTARRASAATSVSCRF